MAERASAWRKHRPVEALGGNIQGAGGLFRIRTLPNSDEPMIDVSPPKRAGEGPKGGLFVSCAKTLARARRTGAGETGAGAASA